MKLASRLGIGLGLFSFLFATYTAVTGPALLPDAEQANAAARERMAKIQASVAAEQTKEGGGCCAKKEQKKTAETEHAQCSHEKAQVTSGCSHGAGAACPSKN